MAWEGSQRRSRLPRDWETRRRRVLRMARNECAECGAHANQVDHIEAGDDHSFGNLQALCQDCHDKKSSREGAVARARNQARLRALTRRKPEEHPGAIKGRPKPANRKGW